ncbi:MAG TPA: DUF3617 family protein [Candidatus Acidoferrales bacterium]|nr:DUF3617 family protein [Candidatus Acidoferrales bacterium]
MRKAMAVVAISLGASLAFAATGNLKPLKVKTGLWQMTQKITSSENVPPQFAPMIKNAVPMSYKSCVKPKDLIVNPWSNGTDKKRCTWTAVSSTGTDMEVQGTCSLSNNEGGASMQMHGKIHALDSEHGTGSMKISVDFNGQAMNYTVDYTGKWLAATCPADMN